MQHIINSQLIRPVTIAAAAAFAVIGFAVAPLSAADFADRGYRSDNSVRPYEDRRYNDDGVSDEAYEDALRRFDESDRAARNSTPYTPDSSFDSPPYDDRYSGNRPGDYDQPDGDVYAPSNDARSPHRGSLKDGPYAAAPEYRHPQPRDFEARPAPRRHAGFHCLPRRAVKRRLRHQGWRRFRVAEIRGDIAHMFAKRTNTPGRFKLAVDRCTGDIVSVVRAPRRHWRPAHLTWRQSVWNRDW
jgi:hypothetical protein